MLLVIFFRGDLFSRLSVRELKDFRRERGAHVSGNRPELRQRARGIEKLGTRTLSEIKLNDEENRIKREDSNVSTLLHV